MALQTSSRVVCSSSWSNQMMKQKMVYSEDAVLPPNQEVQPALPAEAPPLRLPGALEKI